MIIATMNFCVYNIYIGCSGVFYFSHLVLFFYVQSPRVCARSSYKPNTNFMTAIPDRFHPITIVGRPCISRTIIKYRFSRVPNKSIFPQITVHACIHSIIISIAILITAKLQKKMYIINHVRS